ncbi:MAG: hypothetical protein R2939_00790 [Kofleriaceae bacterium]
MQFERAVEHGRDELAWLLAQLAPRLVTTPPSWSEPHHLTVLALGLDQWPFVAVRAGEAVGPRARLHGQRSLGPLVRDDLGERRGLRLDEPDLVTCDDLELPDDDALADRVNEELARVQPTLACVLYGVLLTDLWRRRATSTIAFARDARLWVARDVDELRWSGRGWGRDRRLPRAREDVLARAACAEPAVGALVCALLDAVDGDDVVAVVTPVLDAHPEARARLGIPPPPG